MCQEATFPKEYFSVSEIGELTEKALLSTFPDSFWVKGEITNLNNQKNFSKGYIFCALKDEHSQITLYIPSSSPAFRLMSTIQDGTEVYVYAKINYYIKQNTVSLRVLSLLVSGEGELKRQFEMMKERLQKEGLFDPQYKKPIPLFPRTIGVITSPDGAAIYDILNRTQQPYGAVNVILFPVAVQGKTASLEIAQAIEVANSYFKKDIDILIVGRGGGSVEDLWAFNEEIVARAIFRSEIPVISAVGHEVDWTIADYVADFRAPTPTAAAEHIMKEIIAINRTLHHYATSLSKSLDNRFQSVKHTLEAIHPQRLSVLLEERLTNIKAKLQYLGNQLLRSTEHTFEKTSFHLATLFEKMILSYQSRIQKTKHTLSLLGEKIKAFSPSHILARGYSLTYRLSHNTKKLLTSSTEVSKGETLLTLLSEGEIISTVETTKYQKRENFPPNEIV